MGYFLIYDIETGQAQSSMSFEGAISQLFLSDGMAALETPEFIGDTNGIQVVDGELQIAPPDTAREQQRKLAEIKREANRRIVAICPEWKQRNLTAQAAQLARKGEANWTQAEADAWAAGEALWAQVAAIRAASDAIEAMDPLPDDITADNLWPEG